MDFLIKIVGIFSVFGIGWLLIEKLLKPKSEILALISLIFIFIELWLFFGFPTETGKTLVVESLKWGLFALTLYLLSKAVDRRSKDNQ